MPNYNSYELFEDSIKSVINQTYDKFDLIIVDDGSTIKDVSEIYNKYSDYKNIKIIKQKNTGLPAARNKGIEHSDAEFVTFLDSDDKFDKNALSEFINNYSNEDEFLYYGFNLFGEASKISYKNFNKFEQLFLNQLPYSIFIKRNSLLNIGKYDISFIDGFEDWELNVRLIASNYTGILIEKPLFHYHFSSKGMLYGKSIFKYSQNFSKIKNKNKKIYNFWNVIKIYKESKVIKSSYNLNLYLLWYLFTMIFPNFIINFVYLKMFKLFSQSYK